MSIGVSTKKVISKTMIDYWNCKGYCYQFNQVVEFPSATNKYFLFDPTAVPDDYVLHVTPLIWNNPEDGPAYVNFYFGSDYSGGTPLFVTNRNGNFAAQTPYTVVTENPTGTTLGLKTSSNKMSTGGVTPAFAGGGAPLDIPTYISSNQGTVLIEIVNDSGGDFDAEGFLEICEVPISCN